MRVKRGNPGRLYLTIILGRDYFGIDAASVLEIRDASQLMPFPAGPPSVVGVEQRDTTILPVINLHRKLNIAAPDRPKAKPSIVFVRLSVAPFLRVGLLVDRIGEKFNWRNMENPVADLAGEVASIKRRKIRLLQLERLLTSAEIEELGTLRM